MLTAWRKRPIRDSTDSDDYEMFDVSVAAMTHFCGVAGVIKMLEQMLLLSVASLRFRLSEP